MLSPCRTWAPVGALLLASLTACSEQTIAPDGQGICWRMFETADHPPRFEIVDRNVPNLESCAVQLEGVRLTEGAPTTGAYNGHFIFADEDQITSAGTIDGARIRVFDPDDRRRIQEGLRTLMADPRSQTPPPGELQD